MTISSPIGDVWRTANVTELGFLGFRTRVHRDETNGGPVLSVSVSTGPQQHVVLHIPRPDPGDYRKRYAPEYSTRELIENLIAQLNTQLAIETLEGR